MAKATGKKVTDTRVKPINSFKFRQIITILPIVSALLIVLTVTTVIRSQNLIMERANNEMTATLETNVNLISDKLDTIKAQCNTLAQLVGGTYSTSNIDQYKDAMTRLVKSNEMVLGSGLWFEPNAVDPNEYYYGPYWYKNVVDGAWDKGELIECWDYSNAEYDYFAQEYYTNTFNMTSAEITDPYYDETSGLVMATCSAPIKSASGQFLGCVTVDVMLASVQNTLANIHPAGTGSIWLIDTAGNYVYHPAFENAAAEGLNISSSTEMGKYVDEIMKSDSGNGDFNYDGKRLLYWSTIPEQGWKMGLTISKDDVVSGINKMIFIAVAVLVFAIVACSAVIVLQADRMKRAINIVSHSLNSLSKGEFNLITEDTERQDEFGFMIRDTNQVIETLTHTINKIKKSAVTVGRSSAELSEMSEQISRTVDDVSTAVNEIATGATQQADEIQTASENAGKISAAVVNVSGATENISSSAKSMEETSKTSAESLKNLKSASEATSEKIDKIADTINATKDAVNNIGEKVEGITSIATQTNLLSLNASIEAARAGEAGRGFAVVAEEIGKLAEDSAKMAEEIKNEMSALLVQSNAAVSAMSDVKESNTETQTALGESIDSINAMLNDIDATTKGIRLISTGVEAVDSSKDVVVDAMSSLSAISEENAASCEETGASMEEINATVNNLADSAKGLKMVAEELNNEMAFFKI